MCSPLGVASRLRAPSTDPIGIAERARECACSAGAATRVARFGSFLHLLYDLYTVKRNRL